jgi:hypothetical protein
VADSGNSAENTKPVDSRLKHLKPWQPGQSGNPSGRPKKKPITEMYERILANPEHLAAIEAATVKALQKGNMAMVLQLREVTDRIEGKVTQPIEADITVNLADAIAEARKRAGK